MRLALATCADLPSWEVDDEPFHRALAGLGVEVDRPIWSDPSVDWSAFDACLIRTTWDYQDRLAEFLVWAARAAAATRLFNPLDIVRWNTHKGYLLELAGRGIEIVPTVLLAAGSRPDLGRLLDERGWRRAFLKPAVGATSRETLPFDRSDLRPAEAHLERLLPAEDLLLQPYLDRVETEGERSLIHLDGRLSHAVRKVPVAGDYRVQDDFGARDERVEATAAERDLARRTLESLGRTLLYARVDLLNGPDGRPLLGELELVEPSLFFRHAPEAAGWLARSILDRIEPLCPLTRTPDGRPPIT